MTGTIVEFILLLVAHAAAGIYSSTLKYNKKITYTVWGTWVVLQTGLLFFTEFVLTNWALQFFVGFGLSLVGQYVIFFVTTKGRLAQRIFTMLTYSIFFCIAMSLFTMIRGTFSGLHWALTALIHAVLLLAIVTYFLRYVCLRFHHRPSLGSILSGFLVLWSCYAPSPTPVSYHCRVQSANQ